MTKTLADLKRDAKAGRIKLELIDRYGEGKTNLPWRLQGEREIVDVNSNSLTLANAKGETSKLYIERASLVEYTDDTLIIFDALLRDLTKEEEDILAGGIEMAQDYYRRNPMGEFYWIQKKYYKESKCPWLCGEKIQGQRYENGKVRDYRARGKQILVYRVIHQ